MNDSQTLTVLGMTYRDRVIGIGEQVICPDGSKFAAQNALELLNCSNLFTDSPSYSAQPNTAGTAVNFTLSGVFVWDCWQ